MNENEVTKKSKYYKNLLALTNEELFAVRDDIDQITQSRTEEEVLNKIAQRAAEITVELLRPDKAKKKEKVATLNEEDETE